MMFDYDNTLPIVLSTRYQSHLGQLHNVHDIRYTRRLNAADELYFVVDKYLDGIEEPLWDKIEDLKLIYVKGSQGIGGAGTDGAKGINAYFEINVTLNEQDGNRKIITAKTLCEAELSQINLYNLEINTEADISQDDYEPTLFYNPEKPEASLLHRVLRKAPAYAIRHVDASLTTMQRSFSIDNTSVYDFLADECAKEFNCLFLFDSTDRTISVYDLCTVCSDCGYRGDYTDVCPECGGRNLRYYGEDTTILVSVENLTDKIEYTTNADQIKNCFRLEAGDDLITSAVRLLNPNGSDYIYYFSDEQKSDMPDELVEKLAHYDTEYDYYMNEYPIEVRDYQSYNALIDRYQKYINKAFTHIPEKIKGFSGLISHLYSVIDLTSSLQSSMMPNVAIGDINASTEADKLIPARLSPIALSSVTSSTSLATIEAAIINYAKVYVNTGYVRIEAENGHLAYDNGLPVSWTGRFKLTNYSDSTDVACTEAMTISVTDNMSDFVEQKLQKSLASDSSDDCNLFDVLSIDSPDRFGEALKYYSADRLISFRDAADSVLAILIEQGAGSEESDLHNDFYKPYYLKLQACEAELDIRQHDIELLSGITDAEGNVTTKGILQNITEIIGEVHSRLDLDTYLGDELSKIFSEYRREDVYSNSNYISDGLDNSQIVEKAGEFLSLARKDIFESGNYQHSITASLYNLLLMKEFSPLAAHFDLGNWIRVKVEDQIYRLRLISYEINFENLQNLPVEFSDVTRTSTGVNDINSILSAADSLATSYSYIETQAANGSDARRTLEKLRAEGLNSALYRIKNADSEEIILDKTGLLARSYNDIEDVYEDNQLKITHNILAFTADNWQTVMTALGLMTYRLDGRQYTDYGLNANYVLAGKVIAGNIYSANYTSGGAGSHINLDDGSFSLADSRITYDGNHLLKFNNVYITWDTINAVPSSRVEGLDSSLARLSEHIDKSISKANQDLARYLSGGGSTALSSNYVISPYLGGGYLDITDGENSVIIDPHNLTGKNQVFLVENKNGPVVSIDTSGNALFNGHIGASGLSVMDEGSVTGGIYNDSGRLKIGALDDSYYTMLTGNIHCDKSFSAPWCILGGNYCGISTYGWLDWYNENDVHTGAIYSESAGRDQVGLWVEARNGGDLKLHTLGTPKRFDTDGNVTEWNNDNGVIDVLDTAVFRTNLNIGADKTMPQISMGYDIDHTAYDDDKVNYFSYIDFKYNVRKQTAKSGEEAGNETDGETKSSMNSGHIFSHYNDLHISTDDPAGKLYLIGQNGISLEGDILYSGDLSQSSSKKYKKNIQAITSRQSDQISKLNPVEFDYIKDGRHSYGLIAEEAAEIMPQIVHFQNGEPDSINYLDLVPFLIKKVQDLEKEVDCLRQEIKARKEEKNEAGKETKKE